MNDSAKAFERLFRDEAPLAVDRALAELRAGRPIVIQGPRSVAIIAAIDAISPSVFHAFAVAGGRDARVVLSAARAEVLGLSVNGPVAVPVSGLDRDSVYRLACGVDAGKPENWMAGDAIAETAIDLCKHALLLPAVLIAHAVGELPETMQRVGLDDVRTVLNRHHHDLEIVSRAEVPLAGHVSASFVVFRGGPAMRDQVAIIVGDPDPIRPIPVRLHSACLTGDLFGSLRCDCGDQLRKVVARLAAEGGGVLLYLDQEGRGTGIRNKMRAYALQDAGLDTIDADAMLGYGADERRYDVAASMLLMLGYREVRLLTNNPDKVAALHRAGIEVRDRQPLTGMVTAENHRYLSTKAKRAGHLLGDVLGRAPQAEGA
ncbi:MAG: cyclohydrolase [Rhodospirillaceae bacterium]|nr:cyclohydrolase [Rhodospirillaceae bacterium]